MTDRTVIRLAGVTKRFGVARAVDDVSLELREGEFFCLLGPSGCGKSTLLRILAGFETADEGAILLDGRDLSGVPPHRRPVNMMFQSYALFPHLTVAGNVAYGVKLDGLGRREVEARVAEMLRLVGLKGFERRYPGQLSGGQQQRVALARALAKRPRVLLLDEPLGALDRALRERTQAELREVQARLGTTFVMVTHDQDEAMGLSDRIGLMEAGRLVQVASPREMYDRPASRFAARFVGAANLLAGTLVSRDGARGRLRGPGDVEIEGVCGDDALAPCREAAAVLRPERLRVVAPGEMRGPNRLAGQIADLVFLGGATVMKVRLASGEMLRASLPTGSGTGVDALRPGDQVSLAIDPDDVRILL